MVVANTVIIKQNANRAFWFNNLISANLFHWKIAFKINIHFNNFNVVNILKPQNKIDEIKKEYPGGQAVKYLKFKSDNSEGIPHEQVYPRFFDSLIAASTWNISSLLGK